MNIYLIRHGRQDCTFCNMDVSLTKAGIRQAELLGKRMANYPIDGLYSSNLLRAMETARIAYGQMQNINLGVQNLNHEIRENLREFDFGDLTGQPDAVFKEFYKESNQQEHIFESDMAYPGGESGKDVYNRAFPVIQEIAHSGKKNVMVVCHGGLIRALLAGMFVGDVSKRLLFALTLENCSITQIYYEEEKQRFYLERFNDYAHLEEDPSLLRRSM